jgi:hypothetical protein
LSAFLLSLTRNLSDGTGGYEFAKSAQTKGVNGDEAQLMTSDWILVGRDVSE